MDEHFEDTVHVVGSQARAVSAEGIVREMPLGRFLQRLAPQDAGLGNLVMADGWRAVFSREPMLIVVHESPPRVVEVEWIREDSPKPYGPGATYRRRTLSFPFQLIFCVFARDRDGRLVLSRRNELFWSTQALSGAWTGRTSPLDDPSRLKYPVLLNVSRYAEIDMREEGKSLAWLCTQNFGERDEINRDDWTSRRIVRAVNGLVQFVAESRFNYSSEFNPSAHNSKELRSWFTESTSVRKIDERMATVAAWEAATRKDPAFIFEVPFLPVGFSIRQVAERIFDMYAPRTGCQPTASDLARIVFNDEEVTGGSYDYKHQIF